MADSTRPLPADIDIARAANMLPVDDIASRLEIPTDALESYGRYKAKVSLDFFESVRDRAPGNLILVTAITPTPAGEGKTTTSIGLADALNRIGKKTTVCLREPSMGPCFGMKGGAAGGGMAQVVPMEDINLHFTGDIHAIELAHNLLAACLDNHIHQGNSLGLDLRRINWRRVIDMNDRALRGAVIGLGGIGNSMPRETGFDITVASEVMAILCLSQSLAELKERLGRIVVGQTSARKSIVASELKCHGAMTVLLKDAIKPNLVQTLENNPCFIHGGPFANIAHGCNSVIATQLGLRVSDYTVTEAGFGADLGAEKFFDIKCRQAGLSPSAVVLVATVRALKLHGGVPLKELGKPNEEALSAGIENLEKHIENIKKYGVPVVVAINGFATDTQEEIDRIVTRCGELGVNVVPATHWANGGAGAEDLAHAVVDTVENSQPEFKTLYPDDMPLWKKIETVAREIYGAESVIAMPMVKTKLKRLEEEGFGNLPVCMAKTQYSFSTQPKLIGRPTGFEIPVRDVSVSAGAGFVVALAGDIMTMPGLPKVPSAEAIDIDDEGNIVGLF